MGLGSWNKHDKAFRQGERKRRVLMYTSDRTTKHERFSGGLAQLGEHLLCKQRVVGSIPSSSTNLTRALKREESSCLLRVQRIDL